MPRKALGKGLDALFNPSPDTSYESVKHSVTDDTSSERRIITIPLKDIIPNREQPREHFSDEGMEDIKKSIAENGIIEPPIVRRNGDFFELVAGERRFRAAKELKYDTIEVILMEVESEEKMMVLSLIENIQREDLNAVEEGKAYQNIMDKMNLTQEELSSIVGKSRSTVANTLRLLNLSERVQAMIRNGSLAPGSARALVTVEDEEIQLKLAQKIARDGLSSRKAESLVKHELAEKKSLPPVKTAFPPIIENYRVDVQRLVGSEVKIKGNAVKGKIIIDYYSGEDLVRILESIKGDSQ
ncbi:ParB/RepB/Spo0J family partition protein [Candidatus Latescibacterota bacterium]